MSDLPTVLDLVRSAPPANGDPPEEAIADASCLREVPDWDTEKWERLFRELPIDAATFRFEMNCSWDDAIRELKQWCLGFRDFPDDYRIRCRPVLSYLGLLLITLDSLRHSYTQRYAHGSAAPEHDGECVCASILTELEVHKAIRVLYAPQSPDSSEARENWDRVVDFGRIRFHRHGTTSFILSGPTASSVGGSTRELALKCILLPYLKVQRIADATRNYKSDYEVRGPALNHLAHVWASSSRWIMMDFVHGKTLAEYLSEAAAATQSPAGALRTDLLGTLGPQLFDALAELRTQNMSHGDLSPSNIIVTTSGDGRTKLCLIDLGVNYLYSHAVSGAGAPYGRYIAPEIRKASEPGGSRRAEEPDIYSLGRLLAAIGTARDDWPADTTPVPDQFYAESPTLARFLEDLTDDNPDRRLLIFRIEPGTCPYDSLGEYFDQELEAAEKARTAHPHGRRDLLAPLARAPRQAWRLWRFRRDHREYREGHSYLPWLMFWAWFLAAAWYAGGTVVVSWWLKDLDVDAGTVLTEFTKKAISVFSEGNVPVQGAMRQWEFGEGTWQENLPVRMVALSSMLVAIRHYQKVLFGLTPLVTDRRQRSLRVWAWCAELTMRLWPLCAVIAAMFATVVDPDSWPIALAIGVTSGFLCNTACQAFVRAAMDEARDNELSTVPREKELETPGSGRLTEWMQTTLLYSSVVWVIGSLLVVGLAKDLFVYAGLVTLLHIDLCVRSLSGATAREVRIVMTRAVLAAERMKVLRHHEADHEARASQPVAGRLPRQNQRNGRRAGTSF